MTAFSYVRLKLAAVAAVIVAALSGCAWDAEAAAPPAPPASAQPAAARHEVFCLDYTTSIPQWFRARLLAHVAGVVEDAVTGSMGEAEFHLRRTTANSYAPEAEMLTVHLPAVPAGPTPPTPSANPYETARNAAEQARFDEEHRIWSADLEVARAAAAVEAERIRSLNPPVDGSGTDVRGCPLRAPALLGPDGDRHLFVGSDLAASGRQQDVTLPAGSLTDVRVTIVPYCADLAGICQQREAEFTGFVEQGGATDITVIDPQDL
ncbi:MAG: hypothetical protein ACT4RN_22565 [Pseudonocardia sp.]